MSLGMENYLQQIDVAFKPKSENEKNMIYVMIFGLFFAFSYLLYWEEAEAGFNEITQQIDTVTAKIESDQSYLDRNPESKIAVLNKEIKSLQAQLVIEEKNNAHIKSKIETISSLIYDEVIWGEYLHSISRNAKKYRIKVLDFTNVYAENNESFGHILDISLETTGKYKNTIKFINSLEKSDLVVDLHTLSMEANNSLRTNIDISVWGITY